MTKFPSARQRRHLRRRRVRFRMRRRFGRSHRSRARLNGDSFEIKNGSVVIAAITSCTNTSNPYVMLGAGLLARNARAAGLTVKPWVKTSLAPGSKVVTQYLKDSGLLTDLEAFEVQRGRLRLHDLYRQQRSASGVGEQRHQRRRLGGGECAQRQPQLRGPYSPGHSRQLLGQPAAGRRLCAGRQHGLRLGQRASGQGQGRKGCLLEGHLAGPRRGREDRGTARHQRHLRTRVRRSVCRRRPVASAGPYPKAAASPGIRPAPTCASPPSSKRCRRSRRP